MKKEDYLEIAVIYEKLAGKYRSLAKDIESQPTAKGNEINFETPPITLETIGALAKKKAANGKSKEVKSIITECGVKKLSDIPQELHADVYMRLEAI